MPEPGDIISAKYRIIERLGSGAMGIVYSALHLDTDKRVAIKWLNPAMSTVPDGQERFKREAKATGRIHHPNVVAVHDCGEHEGQLFLVMEYLAGSTLRATLAAAKDGRFSTAVALGLLFPVMRGISAAHAAGVLHRDLKPENVLLSESPDGLAPIPKVLDFGLAKVRSEAASFAAKLSMPGSVLGTYQYMAPEQLRPQIEVDERIDVYALGAMLYEMLSGRPPYHADNPIDLVLQIHTGEVPPLDSLVPEVPVELSAVLTRALARDREQRFAGVDALAAALEPFTELSFRGDKRDPCECPANDTRPGPNHATAVKRELSAPATHRAPWLHVGLLFLALFAQPTGELAVADSITPEAHQPLTADSAPILIDASAPDTETTQPVSPLGNTSPPTPDSPSNEDWIDQSNVAAEVTQPNPEKAAPPRAAARGPAPQAPRAASGDPRPAAPTSSHAPDYRSGPGTLGVNEF